MAVTLGGGGVGWVSATSPDGATTLIAIEPCRVLDTRPHPTSNIGGRETPLGGHDTHTIAVHGDNGDCTGIPTSATGVSLNVTAVGATALTFLAIWANDGGERPLASSLNPAPGQPPTPNAVVTQVSDTGEFNIFNMDGSVDVIVDVNGYYTDHDHDDRYLTDDEVDARIAEAEVGGPAGPPGADGVDGMDGVDGAELFDRTVVVNGGGTSLENGEAFRAAVSEVESNGPTVNDPWTIFLEPGLFELDDDVVIPDHVTVTGSGMEATTIEKTEPQPGVPMLQLDHGALRNVEILGSDQHALVASEGSVRVESVRFLVDDSTGLELDNGPHTVVDSEFVVTTTVNAFAINSTGEVSVRSSTLTALNGSSVELIAMNGGDMTVENSTIEGQAVGIFSCCTSNTGELTVRHSTIDVTREAILANVAALAVTIESSSVRGVGLNVVAINAGGSVATRSSAILGGDIGGFVPPAAVCRGTSTNSTFLTTTCP